MASAELPVPGKRIKITHRRASPEKFFSRAALGLWIFLVLPAVFHYLTWQETSPVVAERSYSYLQPAEELLAGGYSGPETLRRTPVYPLFLAAVKVSGGGMRAVTLLQHAAVILTALVFMLVSLQLWNSRAAALLTGALIGFHPRLLFYADRVESETVFLLLSSVSVLLFLREILRNKPRALLLLLASAAGGAAALCRPEFALYFLVPPAFLAARKRKLRELACATVPFSGLVFLWMLRNLVMFGMFTLSPMGAITSLQTSQDFINWDSPEHSTVKAVYREVLRRGWEQNAVSAVVEIMTKPPGPGLLEAVKETAGLGYETFRGAPLRYLWASKKNFLDFALTVNEKSGVWAYFLELSLLGLLAAFFLRRGPGLYFLAASIACIVASNCFVEIGAESRRSLEVLPLLAVLIPLPFLAAAKKLLAAVEERRLKKI